LASSRRITGQAASWTICSIALAILVEANHRLGDTNGGLRIVGPAPAVRRRFEIAGLDRLFAFYPTRTAALDGES
jgi:anti-anti-sigma factor